MIVVVNRDEEWKETTSFFSWDTSLIWVTSNCQNHETLMNLRVYRTELVIGAMGCSDSDTEIVTEPGNRNVEHQCRLCNKIFRLIKGLVWSSDKQKYEQ